jgi:hypothetical protein
MMFVYFNIYGLLEKHERVCFASFSMMLNGCATVTGISKRPV